MYSAARITHSRQRSQVPGPGHSSGQTSLFEKQLQARPSVEEIVLEGESKEEFDELARFLP